MAATMTGRDREAGYQRQNFSVITNARPASSQEMSTRMRRYAITMAFRTACFVAMIFVPGVWRWVLLAFAVFLPYVAVLFANQANQRGMTSPVEPPPAPDDARQLTVGPEEVISGHVVDEDSERAATDRRDEDDHRSSDTRSR